MRQDGRPTRKASPSVRYGSALRHWTEPEMVIPARGTRVEMNPELARQYQSTKEIAKRVEKFFENNEMEIPSELVKQYQYVKELIKEIEMFKGNGMDMQPEPAEEYQYLTKGSKELEGMEKDKNGKIWLADNFCR